MRATIDPHDAEKLGLSAKRTDTVDYISTPESTVIRQILLECLGQLPQTGYNLVIFGQVEGQPLSLEDALYGSEFFIIKDGAITAVRSATGAFGQGSEGDSFRMLSGVLRVRLDLFGSVPLRTYKLYLNPTATFLLPDAKYANNRVPVL